MIAARFLTRVAVARPAVSRMAVRNFTAPSAPLMQDIIKDLYLKELKGYKPVADPKADNAAANTKAFSAPAAPAAPAVDAAADLAAWEQANVEIADAIETAVEEEEEEEEEEQHHH